MSIRARIALLLAFGAVILMAVGGAVLVHQLEDGLDASLDATLHARADLVVERLSAGQPLLDGDARPGLLSPHEAVAQVLDPGGHVIASSAGTPSRSLLTRAELGAARHDRVSLTTRVDDTSMRLLAVPIDARNGRAAVAVVGTTRQPAVRAVADLRNDLVLAGIAAAILAGLAGWVLSGMALRPVRRMSDETARISASNIRDRVGVPRTRDEIAWLGVTLNDLLERLQRALEQQQNLVADAGHELHTPLAILRAELELAARPHRPLPELLAGLHRAEEETDRLIRLADDLLLLARVDAAEVVGDAPLRLDLVLVQAVDQAVRRADGVRVELAPPPPVEVRGDPDHLRRVFDNLLENALRFTPRGGVIAVRLEVPDRGSVAVEVLDQGPGFPPDFLPHAFERFRQADAARGGVAAGAGLGLAITHSLVRAHGGSVAASNRAPSPGACVRVELPRLGEDLAEPGSQPPVGQRPSVPEPGR